MTLTEFLNARYDERERMYEVPEFQEVESARGPGWGNRGDCDICWASQYDGTESVTEEAYIEHLENAHQMTWALADIAAKRAIVAAAVETLAMEEVGFPADERGLDDARSLAEFTILTFAQAFTEHADFDPAWRV